ncbi:Vacuolar protein sorting-associated protein 8 [Knufia peltigerae]|uniref:Vacuolar protein sorting-associated protein 8 n=1 Tax=Knufia peltigerae TaxID=1002370 RepID=A0AA38XTT1_9EURO|nr:Vacuolar protein sorting-associated protein 8 [Knufia peltigerae]
MSSPRDEGENPTSQNDEKEEVHSDGGAVETTDADVPDIENGDVEGGTNTTEQHQPQEENNRLEDEEPASVLPPNGVDGVVPFRGEDDARSTDDTVSTPDESPSIQGSVLSSPRSETPSFRSPARRGSPSLAHRPFDTRFQSRLSGSHLSPLRSSSPGFLGAHSRHSSITSFAGLETPSEVDESGSPWDVIRWNKYKRITGQTFSEIGRRNFGNPTCLAVADQVVIGTSKGIVLVFDHQQNHKAIIGSGTKAAESGAVTALAISADHTTIAVGHVTGHIFTWELARSSRPFLHILPVDNSHPQGRRGDGHIMGSTVLHIGFLGYRHTALVSADDKGMAFSHLATRGMGAVSRVVRTARILGRYPEVVTRTTKPLKKSSVLAFAPLPLGNIEQRTDNLGLVAMLTPYLLVIVSTTPVAQTQHKAARPKEVAAHSAMTAALAWFPALKLKAEESQTSRTKLVYAWSNIITILEVHEAPPEEGDSKDKPPELQFLARSRYQAEEAVVAIQWLNRSVMAVLTITQQLLIIEDLTMHVTESFDLLKKHVYHADLYSQQLQAIIESLDEEDTSMHGVVADAFHMSFRAYKGRLFLLGFNDIWTGVLTNWADRLLALMNVGDFIGAIRLATKYYLGEGEKATIGLPEEDRLRASMVQEKLIEMMTASLKYAFGKNQQAGNEPIEKPQMIELADACIQACLTMGDQDFLFEEVFPWYDDNDHGPLFVDILEPYILDERVVSIPPPALKTLIDHFAITHTPSTLEEIVCMLDTSTMDIDQVTSLCKRYNLYDAYIYVWTMALHDYETMLTLLLDYADTADEINQPNGDAAERYTTAQKIFPYISFILTSRIYPTGAAMDNEETMLAKGQIYDYFFSGNNKQRGLTPKRTTSSFENLSRILRFDAASFIAALNEAFEDSFLNSSDDDGQVPSSQRQPSISRTYTRQYVVRIMLEVMSSGFEAEDTIYLDMFIARNLAKYPQYMVLSGTVLQDVFNRLCQYPEEDMREDAQLSVEYLLSVFQPPNALDLVPLLREAKFYRVLKAVFRQEGQYAEMIRTYFLDEHDQDEVYSALSDSLRAGSNLGEKQRKEVRSVIEQHAADLVGIDIQQTATTIDKVASDLHNLFLQVLAGDQYGQYEYLKILLEPDEEGHKQTSTRTKRIQDGRIMELYVKLLCQFDASHVREYIEHVQEGDLRLDEVLPTIEESGIIDAVVVLQVRQGRFREAMDRLVTHLSFLDETLKATTSRLFSSRENGDGDSDDGASIHRPVTGILANIRKYTLVGVWLCRGQRKNTPRPSVSKSPGRSANATTPLTFEETLWLDLMLAVVSIARDNSITSVSQTSKDGPQIDERDGDDDDRVEIATSLRGTIQSVFTALLTSTTSTRDLSKSSRDSHDSSRDMTFLRILRAFLTQAAQTSPSLSELRSVIASIFSAYAYEESLLALSNSMLDKDVFVQLEHVGKLRHRGWRPRGQVCEVCRRRVWGPGVGVNSNVWEQWTGREEARRARRLRRSSVEDLDGGGGGDVARGKGKATRRERGDSDVAASGGDGVGGVGPGTGMGPIVVFSCRHLYHRSCLDQDQGREQDPAQGPDGLGDGLPDLVCPACV